VPIYTLQIISGGQTGADRAALDFAIEHGIPHGGWCPKGRIAEDGIIPDKYLLKECSTEGYVIRTEQNVIDSDGTVIISLAPVLSGGSQRTAEFAAQHGRPWLQLHKDLAAPGRNLAEFVRTYAITRLNVAGPRASEEPEIGRFVIAILSDAFQELRRAG
jgi:hypothetical protein